MKFQSVGDTGTNYIDFPRKQEGPCALPNLPKDLATREGMTLNLCISSPQPHILDYTVQQYLVVGFESNQLYTSSNKCSLAQPDRPHVKEKSGLAT